MTAPVARLTILVAALAGAAFAADPAAAGCGGAECYRHVTTPPVYGSVSEQVLVRPAETVYRTTPPVYETVSEQVQVSPGGRVWQTRHDPYGGLVGCWVDVPPQYSVRHRRVLVEPAHSIPETIPAEYAHVQRRVLVAPARSGWVPAGESEGGFGGYGGGVGFGGYRSAGYGGGVGFGGYRSAGYRQAPYGGYGRRGYRGGYGGGVGSIPDAIGVTGASSADIGVGLGFSTGSVYDGY